MGSSVFSTVLLIACLDLSLTSGCAALDADDQKPAENRTIVASNGYERPTGPYKKIVDHQVTYQSSDGETRAVVVYYQPYFKHTAAAREERELLRSLRGDAER